MVNYLETLCALIKPGYIIIAFILFNGCSIIANILEVNKTNKNNEVAFLRCISLAMLFFIIAMIVIYICCFNYKEFFNILIDNLPLSILCILNYISLKYNEKNKIIN